MNAEKKRLSITYSLMRLAWGGGKINVVILKYAKKITYASGV